MMNDTGWSFNDIRSEMVNSEDICSNDLFNLLGETLNFDEIENVHDGVIEDIISEKEWEEIFSYLERIFEYKDKQVECANKKVQSEIMNIHMITSKSLSSSLIIFKIMITEIATDNDMIEEFGEEQTEYLLDALQCYCEEHKDNQADKLLIDSFNEIEKLGRSKYTTGCDEVQNEVKKNLSVF